MLVHLQNQREKPAVQRQPSPGVRIFHTVHLFSHQVFFIPPEFLAGSLLQETESLQLSASQELGNGVTGKGWKPVRL